MPSTRGPHPRGGAAPPPGTSATANQHQLSWLTPSGENSTIRTLDSQTATLDSQTGAKGAEYTLDSQRCGSAVDRSLLSGSGGLLDTSYRSAENRVDVTAGQFAQAVGGRAQTIEGGNGTNGIQILTEGVHGTLQASDSEAGAAAEEGKRAWRPATPRRHGDYGASSSSGSASGDDNIPVVQPPASGKHDESNTNARRGRWEEDSFNSTAGFNDDGQPRQRPVQQQQQPPAPTSASAPDSQLCCNKVKLSAWKEFHESWNMSSPFVLSLLPPIHPISSPPPPSPPPPRLLPTSPPPPPPHLLLLPPPPSMTYGAITWETFHFVTAHSQPSHPKPPSRLARTAAALHQHSFEDTLDLLTYDPRFPTGDKPPEYFPGAWVLVGGGDGGDAASSAAGADHSREGETTPSSRHAPRPDEEPSPDEERRGGGLYDELQEIFPGARMLWSVFRVPGRWEAWEGGGRVGKEGGVCVSEGRGRGSCVGRAWGGRGSCVGRAWGGRGSCVGRAWGGRGDNSGRHLPTPRGDISGREQTSPHTQPPTCTLHQNVCSLQNGSVVRSGELP